MTVNHEPPCAGLAVARIEAGQWAVFKELRLHALAESPHAFGQTLAQAQAISDEEWRAKITAYATAEHTACFLANSAGRPIGMAGTFLENGHPERCFIFAVWIHPEFRRQGAAGLLLAAAEAWAQQRAVRSMRMWVAEANAAAARSYERLGYAPNGVRKPRASDPASSESLYEKVLAPV